MAPAEFDGRDVAVCVFAPVTLLTVTLEKPPDGSDEVHIHPGGQGVWQARMIAALGARPVLCTPLGGESGAVLGPLLTSEGIEHRELGMDGANGVWIHDRRDGQREPLWEGSLPTLGRHELDELYSATLAEALSAGVCVVAGTHEAPEVVQTETYRRLAADLGASGVPVVADVTGGELEAVLEGAPHVVKLSDEDMIRDGLLENDSDDGLRAAIERLRKAGARNVVVSQGGTGALAVVGDRVLRVRSPELEVADARGAGDSMTAALAVGIARGLDWSDALRLAAAAGAVNVTRHGSGSGRADAIFELAKRVEVDDEGVA